MQAANVTILGLALDIIGAFFLSVEAIKLQNLRRAQKYLDKAIPALLFYELPVIGMPVFLAVSLLTLLVAAFNMDMLIPQFDLLSPILGALLSVLIPLLLLAGAVFLVFGVPNLLLRILNAALQRLEDYTAKGIIGILGFLLIFAGFILQGVGAALGAG